MAVYVLYVFCVAAFMLASRLKAIRRGELSVKYFKTYQGSEPSDRLVLIADHYQNQFEVPMVFLVTCAALMAADAVSAATVGLAWFFVVTRFVHGWVHLGGNNVRHRLGAFGLGWLAILAMWGLVFFQ
jgi:hypothetical protein